MVRKMTISEYRKTRRWITNGLVNKTIDKSDKLPDNFFYGKTLNKIWVNNGTSTVFIDTSDLEKYLNLGYTRGRKMKKTKCWITNGLCSKLINIEELENYLEDGWFKGRLF